MPPQQSQRRDEMAAAVAAAATAAVAAQQGDGGGEEARKAIAAAARRVARAVATILATVLAFFAERRRRDERFVRGLLTGRGDSKDDIEEVIHEERERATEFARRAQDRLARDLPVALAIPDEKKREERVRAIMQRERGYVAARGRAMAARSVAAVERVQLRRESPKGAFWKLDPTVQEHTPGCLVLGDKFWPWEVLDRVHPPRHGGCPCRLMALRAAIAAGYMRASDVPDTDEAIAAAADVVMESAEPDLVHRLALRDAMIEHGLTTADAFDAAVGSV